MEIWKTLRVSHISTPPTATTNYCLKRRYTNIPLGTKNRSRHTLLQFARYFPIFSGNSGISKEADVRWFGEYDLTQVHVHLAACDQRVDHVWFHNTVNLHQEIQQGYSWLCFDYRFDCGIDGPRCALRIASQVIVEELQVALEIPINSSR